MAISSMACGLLPLTQTAIRFAGRIGYHDYEGPVIELDERERLVRDLGMHNAISCATTAFWLAEPRFRKPSTPCTSLNFPAARKSMPWRGAPN